MKYYFHHSCEISAHTASARRRYVRTKFVILDPEQLENYLITVFIIFDKINLKIQKFRRNLDDAILHARRRTMSRWKALTFLQNISANQRDRIPRRDTRRAQTRKLTFFILFFEITCTIKIYIISTLYELYIHTPSHHRRPRPLSRRRTRPITTTTDAVDP